MESLSTFALATVALGTAAFGIVEALKWTRLGEAGFEAINEVLGPLAGTLKIAYGEDYEKLLRAQYRGESSELRRTLMRGIRAGLRKENARQLAEYLGIGALDKSPDALLDRLEEAARLAEEGVELPAELRGLVARFETAAETRIDAALALAQSRYAGATRTAACAIALTIALAAGIYLHLYVSQYVNYIFQSLLAGVAAMPLAPIVKDIVSLLQSAGKAIRGRR